MPISSAQYLEMLRRVSPKRTETPGEGVPAGREVEELHKPILAWLNSQHPKVPYIYSRPDQPATISLGVNDFTIFYKGRVLLIECKTKTGKVSREQMGWALLCELNGFKVEVIRSWEEFERLTSAANAPATANVKNSL